MSSGFLGKLAERLDFAAQSRAELDLDGARPQQDFYERKIVDLKNILENPGFSVKDLDGYLDAIRNANGVGLDDRKFVLESVLSVMSTYKEHRLSKVIQEAAINLLYKDLPHPVSGYLRLPPSTPPTPAQNLPYVYRPANGSFYNPLYPAMGMAGTPYARTVPSRHTLPKDSLPDPDLVFDTLLKRDKFEPHPGGMSALFFAFADLVIHSIFKTNRQDWTINDASSYLDLSVLYGHNDKDVEAVRRKDGTGKLWNDVFADSRLTHMPPASCALLYVAQKILDINECGKERQAQDLEIFNRARLVNCALTVTSDYVGAILGLVRDRSDWRLDPMMPMRKVTHEVVPLGEGNVCSIEFQSHDTEWTEAAFKKMFTGMDTHAREMAKNLTLDKVQEWTFAGLKRGTDGRFSDDDLARLIQNSIEYRAGAFKARGIPEAMRVIEVMGIKQSRTWGTCSLNEFRKFMGLKPHESFRAWNSDPKIFNAAQALYRDIDNLELHVGLQAEEAKPPMPGAGLCPGYTVSRAILADAVCLVRGDRFFTSEYTPTNLTSWGFQDCQYDKADGAFGGLLTKLLLRTLPNHFPRGSAYAHFPFLVPSYLEDRWKREAPELVTKYTWARPRKQPTIVPVGSYEAVKRVSSDSNFISAYDTRLKDATNLVLGKSAEVGSIRRHMSFRGKRATVSQAPAGDKALVENRDTINDLLKTKGLIKEKKFTSVGGKTEFVDIVRDVINNLPVHFISQVVAGLSLKCEGNDGGVWREAYVSTMLEEIAEYVYLNFSPEHDWRLREATQGHTEKIVKMIKPHVEKLKSWFGSLSDSSRHLSTGLGQDGHEFLEKVVVALRNKEHNSAREIAAQVFAAVVPSAALYAASLSQIVNFFLQPSNAEAREKSKDAGASAELMGYVREALRLNPAVPGFYRTAGREFVLGSQNVQAFEVVYGSLYSANRDPEVYGPNPEVPVYNRQGKEPILGLPQTGLTSDKFIAASIGPILAEILSLKGVELTPNNNGRFTGFQESWHTYPRNQYIDGSGAVSQFPDSLMIQFQKA
ncbi:heme peroxidase [Coprinopsis sp. MPI-PUGE-AT-0042]|nr:heme peroxidase [Coprinopsis sp. MPI-PUGE-AT-0042]